MLLRPSSARSPSPSEDPIAALTTARDVCRGTGELPDPIAAWLAKGFDEWLRAPGASLEQCLGLKPGRGGRFNTPHERSKRAARERVVHTLLAPLSGSAWSKAKALHADPATAKAFDDLAAGGVDVPRTVKGIHQLILRISSNRD